MSIAYCIKGVIKTQENNYILNSQNIIKQNDAVYKDYHKLTNASIINPLKEKYKVDVFISSYNSIEKDNVIDLYKPKNYIFTEFNNCSSWKAQLMHFKKLIKMVKESNEKYLFAIFTRFDIIMCINILNYYISLDTLNLLYKHKSPGVNGDDNFFIVPMDKITIFDDVIDHLLRTNGITHAINYEYEKRTRTKCNYMGINHDFSLKLTKEEILFHEEILLIENETTPINFPCSKQCINKFRIDKINRWKERYPNNVVEILSD